MPDAIDNIESRTISRAALREARLRAEQDRRRVVDVLEDMLAWEPRQFLHELGRMLSFSVLDMAELRATQPDFSVLPYHEAVKQRCFVGSLGAYRFYVTDDPFDLMQQTRMQAEIGALECRLVHRADLSAYLALHEESMRAMDGMTGSGEEEQAGSGAENISLKSIAEDSSPVVKLVNSTIYDALKAEASDIHIEAVSNGLQIKYRIDGVLVTIAKIPGNDMAEQVVSRIKVMAELDIAERRVPQDGRFKLTIKGQEIDFRVSVMPSLFNEDIVIRILDKRSLADQIKGLRLDYLGFDAATIEEVRQLARHPYGMLLVTGPTGSGKTTTLYAALSEINNGQDKIVTIEDPIEYQLPGVLQIPVNEKKGLTFARGLRSILRHDPDKILVGEIRDPETAQIAIQSALTGHLVFTSVHANNVFDVLGRFLHMGVDTYSFVSALNGILAQRLLRVNCPQCSEEYAPSDKELAHSGVPKETAAGMRFCRGRGCGNCRGSGYKGRHAIGEVLHLTDEIRELIIARAQIRTIKEVARANGTRNLRQSALDLVAAGRTTLEEIDRVTFVS